MGMAVLARTFTRTHNETRFADPYKKCLTCGGWIDGYLDNPGRPILTPCEHDAGYRDVCPSWSPVDGCGCAAYSARHPGDPIVHETRV
jgi:hypothetical protein